MLAAACRPGRGIRSVFILWKAFPWPPVTKQTVGARRWGAPNLMSAITMNAGAIGTFHANHYAVSPSGGSPETKSNPDRVEQSQQGPAGELVALRSRRVRDLQQTHSQFVEADRKYKVGLASLREAAAGACVSAGLFGLGAVFFFVRETADGTSVSPNPVALGSTFMGLGAAGILGSACSAVRSVSQWVQVRRQQTLLAEQTESSNQAVEGAEAAVRQEAENVLIELDVPKVLVDIIKSYDNKSPLLPPAKWTRGPEEEALPAPAAAPRQAWPAPPADHVVEMPD
jgi:hypothetical protein